MWEQIIIAALVLAITPPVAVILYSFVRTAGGRRYTPNFYEKDKRHQPGSVVKRQFQGAGHMLYRLADTLRYAYPLLMVYLFRTISPVLREKVMISTAVANSCAQ